MGADLFTGRRRELQLRVTDVAPPMALYVTQEDQLRIQTVNFAASASLEVSARILLPDGQIVPIRRIIALVSTRSTEAFLFPLPEGWLLTVMMNAFGTTINRGETFVQAQLVRGTTTDLSSVYMLFSGYLTSTESVSWPGGSQLSSFEGRGNIRSITGTNPAVGVEISETVPTNAIWRLVSVRFSLITDGTGVARKVTLSLDDGTNEFARLEPFATQAISTTIIYTWASGASYAGVGTNGQSIALPVNIYLREAFRIATATSTLAAGDNFSAPQYLVEEWLQT